jgi:hypothetical protein
MPDFKLVRHRSAKHYLFGPNIFGIRIEEMRLSWNTIQTQIASNFYQRQIRWFYIPPFL